VDDQHKVRAAKMTARRSVLRQLLFRSTANERRRLVLGIAFLCVNDMTKVLRCF